MLNDDMRGMRRRRRTSTAVLAAGLAVVVALLLAGCSNDDPKYKPGTLPPLSPSASASGSASATPTASPTGTQGMSDKDQVKAVYVGFISSYRHAQDLRASQRREYLAHWMADPALADAVKVFSQQERRHERSVGRLVPRVLSTKVDRSTAKLDACVDQRKFNLTDSRTGKVLTSGGSPTYWAVADLKRTPSGWRIVKIGDRRKTCALR